MYIYVCVWQSDTLKVCILLQPTHRPRPLCIICRFYQDEFVLTAYSVNCLFCELHYDFNDHFLKLDNETKLKGYIQCKKKKSQNITKTIII